MAWKPAPGDVALVRNEYNVWNVAICAIRAGRRGFVWSYGVADLESPIEADARPLVVIDPEDDEGVKVLMRALWRADRELFGKRSVSDWVPLLAGALRSLVAPCGASLTLGSDGALYRCSEDEGHDGPHVDGTCTWSVAS